MYRHILVPLDGSQLSSDLVSQAVDFAAFCQARVTFFNMRTDYGATQDGALQRTMSPSAFAEVAAGDANAILAKAAAAAAALKVDCECVVRTGSQPWQQILQVASERSCDLIFMAPHGRKGFKALVLGSQTRKVLDHASLPVLVATPEGNRAAEAGDEAIRIIKDEHRAIAAVLTGLRDAAQRLRSGGGVDHDFLADMIHYIKLFPERLHHPKEDMFLFRALKARTSENDELILALELEHREAIQDLAEIEGLLEGCKKEVPPPTVVLADMLELFVDGQWRHLSAEEKLILPAARQHLTAEDWLRIENAFRENSEDRIGHEQEAAFARLFARLMNLAARG